MNAHRVTKIEAVPVIPTTSTKITHSITFVFVQLLRVDGGCSKPVPFGPEASALILKSSTTQQKNDLLSVCEHELHEIW